MTEALTADPEVNLNHILPLRLELLPSWDTWETLNDSNQLLYFKIAAIEFWNRLVNLFKLESTGFLNTHHPSSMSCEEYATYIAYNQIRWCIGIHPVVLPNEPSVGNIYHANKKLKSNVDQWFPRLCCLTYPHSLSQSEKGCLTGWSTQQSTPGMCRPACWGLHKDLCHLPGTSRHTTLLEVSNHHPGPEKGSLGGPERL